MPKKNAKKIVENMVAYAENNKKNKLLHLLNIRDEKSLSMMLSEAMAICAIKNNEMALIRLKNSCP